MTKRYLVTFGLYPLPFPAHPLPFLSYIQRVKSFASDNYASIHPKILQAISAANEGHAVSYGADIWTQKLNEKIKAIFGSHAEAFPVFNGTGANVVSLASILKSYEAVLCSNYSHTHMDECGAAERLIGTKLIDVPTQDAKLTPEILEPHTLNFGNEHQVQARVLSITQSTERGTVYTIEELKALGDFAKTKKIRVCMDGARFANAVAALNVNPREIVEAAGVELLSFGGTKNGLMLGELVVSFNPEVSSHMKFYRKQYMQLTSKMRYISAQFCEYFENNLWIENAKHANAMNQYLLSELQAVSKVEITVKPEVNAIFAKIPKSIIQPLQKDFPFYIWEELPSEECSEVRWMTSFDTSKEDVHMFVKRIKELTK